MELDFTLEDKNELEFELDNTEIDVEVNKDHDKLNHRDYPDQHPISAITGLQEALDNSGKQIYKGENEPTDEKILIWIDTSEEPVVKGRLLTSDGQPFITVDGNNFLVAQTEDGETTPIPINVNSLSRGETLSIEDYVSRYTGQEIDGGLALAYTAVQPADISNFITKDVDDLTYYTPTSSLGDLATKNTVDYETEVTNKPTIPTVPTNVSAFNNDAGYLTLATLPIYNGGVQ